MEFTQTAVGTLTSLDIKQKAASLGFDLCGIASAESFPELAFLQEWLDRGYAGDMAWMARTRDRRADVRNVVPDARSVIVTGTLYNTDRPYTEELPSDIARLSRYAWGDDYHSSSSRGSMRCWRGCSRRVIRHSTGEPMWTQARCRSACTRSTRGSAGSGRTRA